MGHRLTFRIRLLIGHILPVLILVPLVGLALIYLLETQLILPTLANEMIDQGLLIERLTSDQPDVWTSPTAAQALLDSTNFQRPTRIGLLMPDHVLLATSRPDDSLLVGTILSSVPDTKSLTAPWWAVTRGDLPGEQILDVIVPVRLDNGSTVGLVWVYRRITDIEQVFSTMRLLVLGVLLAGLFITGGIAIVLAESVSRPLKVFAMTIASTPIEGKAVPFPASSESELNDLSIAYNRLQERRQELEESRQYMLASLIHEIGRPLGSLRTALHALQAGAVNDPSFRTELMNGMAERMDRMGRLLEDLALAYRSLDPQEIHIKPVQVNEWLGALIPLWAETARQKQLVWVSVIPESLPVVQTDPERLAQALSNLVNNAIKFTPPGGKVSLEVQLNATRIQFIVNDSGVGIPKEQQDHLFVPFYRANQSSWKVPGLGLGLSIAKSIVELLGGQITLNSTPDQGSTFSISLPYS